MDAQDLAGELATLDPDCTYEAKVHDWNGLSTDDPRNVRHLARWGVYRTGHPLQSNGFVWEPRATARSLRANPITRPYESTKGWLYS